MKKIFLTALILLSACKAPAETRSVLDLSDCQLPCWNTIIPGQTTEDEAVQFLTNSEDIEQRSIQIDNQPWSIFDNHIFFSMRQGWSLSQKPKIRADIYVVNKVVIDLIICGELNTSMGDIVSYVGEPESIVSGNNLGGSRTVILLIPQKGVSYIYDTNKLSDNRRYDISPDIEIDCLDLFDPAFYTTLLDNGFFSSGHYDAEETLKVMYDWDGYGNLDQKYPPRQP